MFTGLILGLGELRSIKRFGNGFVLDIISDFTMENPIKGESISVNGICLTATDIKEKTFSVDVSPETLKRTSLQQLKTGDKVNLERALRLSDRLGGHIVSGHIDCTGTVRDIRDLGEFTVFEFNIPEKYGKYIVEKGSIAIDGISLTINECDKDWFSVSIIPHTIKMTNLQYRKTGDVVNLEFDIIGKYVEKLLRHSNGGVSMELLAKTGFLS